MLRREMGMVELEKDVVLSAGDVSLAEESS